MNNKAVSAVIGVILMVALTVAIAATVFVFVSNLDHDGIGDIHYYTIEGCLEKIHYPNGYTLGNWTYDDFIWIIVDGEHSPNFTYTDINLYPYLGKNVTISCSGCCFDDAIDKIELI